MVTSGHHDHDPPASWKKQVTGLLAGASRP
ncbi:hypothetical protein CSX11_00275 [Mycobacterium goodii]|nr:hypothetical protein CSX11_00275 [Mycolicibacterium goodii]